MTARVLPSLIIAATTLFQYDAIGNVTQLTDPRGFVHIAAYDLMRRLTQYTAPAWDCQEFCVAGRLNI